MLASCDCNFVFANSRTKGIMCAAFLLRIFPSHAVIHEQTLKGNFL